MTLDSILGFFNSNRITFYLLSNAEFDAECAFRFCSLRAPHEYGIYFVEDNSSFSLEEVSNSIILCSNDLGRNDSNVYIKVEHPQLVYYKLTQIASEVKEIGIHPTAIIHPEAKIDDSAAIGAYSIIGRCIIEAGAEIRNGVVIENNSIIGKNSIIDSNTVVGAEGLSWVWDETGTRVKQAQLGGVVIGENCYIGTNVTIVRGSLSDNTIIGDETLIAHGTMIGHGSIIDQKVHIANNVSLAGSSHIETRAFLGSACVISSHVRIPSGCIVGAGAVVTKSYDEPNSTLAGVPAKIITVNNHTKKPKGAPKPYKS